MKKTLLLFITLLTATQLFAIPHVGKVNNIVIFISFEESTTPDSTFRSYYERLLNSNSNSFTDYIKEVSYGKLKIVNHFYPKLENTNNSTAMLCYRDIYSFNYYKPKTRTNSIGYEGEEISERHDSLLIRAIEFVQKTTPIDTGIVIDGDQDGEVDNVMFILNIKGMPGTATWPHSGRVHERTTPMINKEIVREFNLITEMDNGTSMVPILSHEFFHTLGVPDLYSNDGNSYYLGPWDIMNSAFVHPTAHTKHKYLGWIDTISEISEVGIYTLNPLLLATNNCFQIKSPVSEQEFFVLEFRKAIQGTYEENLKSSGLIIIRINNSFEGNLETDKIEMYTYRPNAGIEKATFTDKENRTNFNSTTTDPLCLLINGDKGGISISNVKENEDGTLSFTFDGFDVEPYFKSKDTIMLSNVKNFIHYIGAEETNLLSWTTAPPSGSWISTTNDYSNKKIGFKVLSVNSTDEPRSTTVNLTVNGRLIKTFTLIQNPSPTVNALSHEMKKFSIYPNPVSNGALKVESGELINKIEIFNLFGQKMFSQMINQNNITIPVNHLPKGVYVVRCRFANGSMNNAKVIIN